MTKPALVWAVALLVTTAAAAGQAQHGSRFRFSSDEGLRFDLRGKAITFVIIEDTYFTTANLGGELLYKSHSLGIDGSYFRWRFEHDDDEDVAMYETYERRKYLLFDYKFGFLYWGLNQLYFNSYCKTGSYKMWHAPQDYDLTAADSILVQNRSIGSFNELGIGVGYKRNFQNSRFGIDISANVAKRTSVTDILTYSTYITSRFEDDVEQVDHVFYMRLNLIFHLVQARDSVPERM